MTTAAGGRNDGPTAAAGSLQRSARIRTSLRALLATLGSFLPSACAGHQNALDPAGFQAEEIAAFWWFSLAIASLVFILVVAALGYATFRRRDPAVEAARTERGVSNVLSRSVIAGVAATVVILIVFLIADFILGRRLGSATAAAAEQEILTIEITGHQWWWEIRYPGDRPDRTVTTANELHIPIGRPVRLRMGATDVIHSLWVPNLQGKRDLIPGHDSALDLRATETGVFRGQCAEFCGHQHAKMGIIVVVETPEEFAGWYERQLLPALPPTTPAQARGQEVFLTHSCVMCHTVRGTLAGGNVAPDLTHLASRSTIAAASLPNTRGHLAGWITNPQRIKPGNRMPPNQIQPADLQALLTYLQSLR